MKNLTLVLFMVFAFGATAHASLGESAAAEDCFTINQQTRFGTNVQDHGTSTRPAQEEGSSTSI